jgi:hypothetical protein
MLFLANGEAKYFAKGLDKAIGRPRADLPVGQFSNGSQQVPWAPPAYLWKT